MKKEIFLMFSICFLFYGCKKENENYIENYIENIEVVRNYEGPAPDDVVFTLKVSKEIFSLINKELIKRHVIQLSEIEKSDYSSGDFVVEKLNNNIIKFHFNITHFLIGDRIKISDTILTLKLKTSKELSLKLYQDDFVFEFKNK